MAAVEAPSAEEDPKTGAPGWRESRRWAADAVDTPLGGASPGLMKFSSREQSFLFWICGVVLLVF